VQLPLPDHIHGHKIIEEIDPRKDVDGFHPINVGNLSSGKDSLISCTPLGCYLMIKSIRKNLSGLNALMIGRSNLNGKPMVQLLLKEDCTVTIGHSKTKNLKELCKKADIVVVAAGRANLVKGDWIKKGAIVIDVGINRVKKKNGYKIIGDVEFKSVVKKAKAITPVPGGVGPVTIACLLNNTLKAFKNINHLSSK
jgi:methylenetetrahydrofolate dehydrogenase (NADP+)/methenyltetrahydrofolate cyclohydrolase